MPIDEVTHSWDEHLDDASAIAALICQLGELVDEAYLRRCGGQIAAALYDYFDFAVLADRPLINRQLVQACRSGLVTRQEFEGGLNVDIIAQEQSDERNSQPPRRH